MRNRPSFLIPVGWRERPTLRVPFVERLRSDTLVIPLDGAPASSYEVERIRGSRSPHIPEKAPRYRISWGVRGRSGHEADMCRLDAVAVCKHILVERPVKRVQRCFEDKGIWHGVLFNPESYTIWTFCDEQLYVSSNDRELARNRWAERLPTCPSCLAFETAWICYRVFPHEAKKVADKGQDREKAKERRHARMPTAFDKLLLDDPLNPPLKARRPREEPAEPDPTEEYVDIREDKLHARRDVAERWRLAKSGRYR